MGFLLDSTIAQDAGSCGRKRLPQEQAHLRLYDGVPVWAGVSRHAGRPTASVCKRSYIWSRTPGPS